MRVFHENDENEVPLGALFYCTNSTNSCTNNSTICHQAIDAELVDIMPLVEEAQKAVGSIKSESLSEIRSLRAPPDVIRDILEGVLRLMGIFDTSWVSMKR